MLPRGETKRLRALDVFLFSPAKNALGERVDVGRDRLTACRLTHECVDRSRRVLPRESPVLRRSDKLGDCLAQPRRCATRTEGNRERAPESFLTDAQKIGRLRTVT